MDDRRGNVGPVLRRPGVLVEQFAVLGADAEERIAGECVDDAQPVESCRDRRTVAARVRTGLPAELARDLIERHHGTVTTARLYDHEFTVDEGRARDAPARQRGAELAEKIVLPQQFWLPAGRRQFEASELPDGPNRIQTIPVDGWGRPRSLRVPHSKAGVIGWVHMLPDEPAGFGVEADDPLVTALLVLGVDPPPHHREGGVPAAAVGSPELFWWVLVPIGPQRPFGRDSIAVRAAPLRPPCAGWSGARPGAFDPASNSFSRGSSASRPNHDRTSGERYAR